MICVIEFTVNIVRIMYFLFLSFVFALSMQLLWKAYIDFEISENQVAFVRALYERLLERTSHVKVWISFAQFEAGTPNEEEGEGSGIVNARELFERG
jgi:crooked neck